MTTVDTNAAAAAVDVTPATIRKWAHRHPDLLPRRGKDHRGRTLYDLKDVYDTKRLLRVPTV